MFRKLPLNPDRSAVNNFFIISLLVFYPLLFIWQGLDFTDTGYVITNYQLIFSDPSSVEASFRIWLTDILGGIWGYFFGDTLGLLGYRIAAVLLVYATLYCSFKILQPYIERRYLYWGLFLALIFINRSGYLFNYNSLTAFFYVLAAYFFIDGLKSRENLKIFVAAFVLGLNIFIRLPNILGFFLVIAIFFYGYIRRDPISSQVKQALFFLSGYIAAVLLTLLAIYLLGHLDGYIAAFKGTFTMLKDPTGHHNSDKLINIFLRHHKTMAYVMGWIILGLTAVALVLTVTAKLGSRLLQFAVILAAAAATLYYFYDFCLDWVNMLMITLGSLNLGLVLLLWRGNLTGAGQQELRPVALVALLILILAPLGSNVALRNSIYGMYLAIPLVFAFCARIKEIKISTGPLGLRVNKSELNLLKAVATLLFVFFTLQSAYYYTYRDASDRFKMAYPVQHERLKGVFTTRERAQVVQELLDELPHYVKEGDYLLAYEQISLVYFLTKTKPYLYSAWPMLYGPDKFREALEKAEKERPYLPVIVRAKGNTEDFDWPKSKSPLVQTVYHVENRKTMERFIREKQYKTVWQNSFFEILTPPPYR
ncbi:hypothetical protein Tfer_2225 [Thermincola ferriacetica]|uniref:Glycosyltransferase RgtA/B/C/D-like domain-containing protein n=1 Tax=Thermincola ferriacetica TaxID=281456 RepID=A0A0L6W0X8_9FIRM|nr:hypothetical protein [Thermincola ferriacetica]KNZ69121.1 hypothetical protein Tfer_2225 [Thermincola ferriacetica]